jgi:flagellar biogenesis protein FliO
MRNFAWRLALVAVLACLHLSLLQATEESANQTTPLPEATPGSIIHGASENSTKTSESAPSPTPAPVNKAVSPTAPGMDEFGRLLGYVTLLAALAGAAIYLIKFGIPLHRNRSKEERKLQVLEMRPLGNRQFLIVVGYEETRMLLGVTPGKIDYLCPLDLPSAADRDFSRMMESAEKETQTT